MENKIWNDENSQPTLIKRRQWNFWGIGKMQFRGYVYPSICIKPIKKRTRI